MGDVSRLPESEEQRTLDEEPPPCALHVSLACIGMIVLVVLAAVPPLRIPELWGEHGLAPLLIRALWFGAFLSAFVGAVRPPMKGDREVAVVIVGILLLSAFMVATFPDD